MPVPAPRPTLGYALVVGGAVLFVVNAGVSRVALRAGVDPALLTTTRVSGASIGFVLAAVAVRRSALRPPRGRRLLALVLMGVVGVAGVQWTYNIAIDRIPVGIALLLEYLAPVLVLLWVRFVQKVRVRSRMWLAIGTTLVGLAVVSQVWQGLAFDGIGVAAGLGAAVCFSVYFLVGEHGVGTDDPLRVVLWAFVLAAVAMNVVSPVWRLDGLGHDVSLVGSLEEHTLPLWLVLTWVVLPGTLVPFFLELTALQHLPAVVVTLVATLEPVGATVLGWAWFDESLTAVQLAGGALVLVGIALAQTARTPRRTPVVPEVGG